MPDLGKYAAEVLLAYGGSAVLLIALVWLSVHQARASRRALDDAEARRRDA